MIRAQGPRDLDAVPSLPCCLGCHLRQDLGAQIPLLCVACFPVDGPMPARSEVAASSHPTRIKERGETWSSPRGVIVGVLFGVTLRSSVHSALARVTQSCVHLVGA